MNTLNTDKSERQYYLDWLRILLILTVFLFHIGMVFNSFGWHIKNNQLYPQLDTVMSFLHLWRMPLLFLISGAGTFYALGKRTSGKYLLERIKRLFIPLLAGIFVLVPVQVYFERISSYPSLLAFYPHMFEGVYPEGNFSWHHLWFIAYLFLISLLISPFLKYVRKPAYQNLQTWLLKIVSRQGGINLIILPLFLSQLLLKPYFPEETHDVVNDWAFIVYNLIFFLGGFILFSNSGIVKALKKQKRFLLVQASVMTLVWFLNNNQLQAAWPIAELIRTSTAWSCSVAVLVWTAILANRDHPIRKHLNQAIYPFYLVHQPVIIATGYFITQWPLLDGVKALLLLFLSFILSASIYWFVIRPFSFMRVLFGMKKHKRTSQKNYLLQPSIAIISKRRH
jgi:peptidoglycan/LPS O-acetylase OafA/YrhL